MAKFIYVFRTDVRDKLIEQGYTLLKSDDERSMYIFENSETLNFGNMHFSAVFSDTLTF